MKQLWILPTLMLIAACSSHAQFEGPVPHISEGYGAEGPHGVATVSFPSPLWTTKDVTVYYPSDLTDPVPVIFYSHAWGLNDAGIYSDLLQHMASRGYAVVFSPYKTIGSTDEERYDILFEGFHEAVLEYPLLLDSSRCGFMGHSFGGGATPAMTLRGLVDNGWGADGSFMFMMAPWYVHEVSQTELQTFPSGTNLLLQLYADDRANDHRMGVDLFENISIPDAFKDCVFVYADTVSEYAYLADHSLPAQNSQNPSTAFNAYDSYAVFRLIDALADYTFTGNPDAGTVALGDGSPEQLDMGPQLKPLTQSDDPIPRPPCDIYQYPCDSDLNPRASYCYTCQATAIEDDAEVAYDGTPASFVMHRSYPNPFNPMTTIKFELYEPGHVKLMVYDLSGHVVRTLVDENLPAAVHHRQWDSTDDQGRRVASGTYYFRLASNEHTDVQKVMMVK